MYYKSSGVLLTAKASWNKSCNFSTSTPIKYTDRLCEWEFI